MLKASKAGDKSCGFMHPKSKTVRKMNDRVSNKMG